MSFMAASLQRALRTLHVPTPAIRINPAVRPGPTYLGRRIIPAGITNIRPLNIRPSVRFHEGHSKSESSQRQLPKFTPTVTVKRSPVAISVFAAACAAVTVGVLIGKAEKPVDKRKMLSDVAKELKECMEGDAKSNAEKAMSALRKAAKQIVKHDLFFEFSANKLRIPVLPTKENRELIKAIAQIQSIARSNCLEFNFGILFDEGSYNWMREFANFGRYLDKYRDACYNAYTDEKSSNWETLDYDFVKENPRVVLDAIGGALNDPLNGYLF